jgi:hypothetical protein
VNKKGELGGEDDIIAQHIYRSGVVNPAWPSQGLNVCVANRYQGSPKIVWDGAGGAFIVWTDGRYYTDGSAPGDGVLDSQGNLIGWDMEIYAQHILIPEGVDPDWPQNGKSISNWGFNQTDARIVSDGFGGAIITWNDERTASTQTDIYAHHLLNSGELDPDWPANGKAICTESGFQGYPWITTDGAGGGIIAWYDYRVTNDSRIYAQCVREDGTLDPSWPSTGLPVATPGSSHLIDSLIPDGAGGAYIAWHDDRTEPENKLFVQHILAGGEVDPRWPANGREVSTASQSQAYSDMVLTQYGSAIVVWGDIREGSPDTRLYAQRLEVDGTLDDRMEQNDTCVEQTQLPTGWYHGLMVYSSDADFYRVHIPRSSHIIVTVEFAHAEGDIDLALTVPTCPATPIALSATQTDNESLSYLNLGPSADFFINVYLASGSCNDYSLSIQFEGTGNLDAGVTPSGWDAPAIPRDQPVASPTDVHVTPELDGNSPSTYLNYATASTGPYTLPEWDNIIWVDDDAVSGFIVYEGSPHQTYTEVNNGPHQVAGGRHTLMIQADSDQRIPETNEEDNFWSAQWVWRPLEVAFELPVVRQRPPHGGNGIYLNCDGMEFYRNSNHVWVASTAALHVSDDNDLGIFDDYVGSTQGFSNLIGASSYAENQTDFVVGTALGTPVRILAGVTAWDVPEVGEFAFDWSDARNRRARFDSSPQFEFLGETLPGYRLANVYEALMEAGNKYVFTLIPEGWEMSFEVFPATPGGIHGRGGGTQPLRLGGGMQTLTYQAQQTGFHPIVVYRDRGSEAHVHIDYDFYWYAGVTDVPGQERPAYRLAFHGVWPNPMTDQGRIAFELAKPGPVRLTVFDLRGRRVGTVIDGVEQAGPHSVSWSGRGHDGKRLGAGIYWMRFEAEGQELVKRVVLLN